MDLKNTFEKYHNLVKEENKFNYKYHPCLTSGKYGNRKLSEIFRDNINIKKIKIAPLKNNKLNDFNNKEKVKEKIMNDNDLIKKESILGEKFFIEQLKKKKGLLKYNKNKIKGFFTKSHCPFCNKLLLSEKEEKSALINNLLTDSNNIKSCFIFKTNNFPLINTKINKYFSFKKDLHEEKIDKIKIKKKADMESELTKNKKIKKYKEIKREKIKTNNLYMIERPLLVTMREKVNKNMRKRYKKPMRLIILDNIRKKFPINTSNNKVF